MINDEDSQTRVLTGEGASGLAWAIFARDRPMARLSSCSPEPHLRCRR